MSAPPIPLRYEGDGEFRVTSSVWAKRADNEYVVGQVYLMSEEQRRSIASHNHEFAWLHEAWMNLPEALAQSYPTAEHLRKRGLIEAGYYNEQIVNVGTNAAALRVASAFRSRDDFLLVIVRGAFVVIREAKSQSRRAMPGGEFQASKTALMETVAAMIGVDPLTLMREAGKAA